MISALTVLAAASLAQPLQFWGLSFVIVSACCEKAWPKIYIEQKRLAQRRHLAL